MRVVRRQGRRRVARPAPALHDSIACVSSGGRGDAESPVPRQRSMRACSASARCLPQMLHGSPPRRGSAGVWK
eukprot:5405334-Prymnesium_polylepis.1